MSEKIISTTAGEGPSQRSGDGATPAAASPIPAPPMGRISHSGPLPPSAPATPPPPSGFVPFTPVPFLPPAVGALAGAGDESLAGEASSPAPKEPQDWPEDEEFPAASDEDEAVVGAEDGEGGGDGLGDGVEARWAGVTRTGPLI